MAGAVALTGMLMVTTVTAAQRIWSFLALQSRADKIDSEKRALDRNNSFWAMGYVARIEL